MFKRHLIRRLSVVIAATVALAAGATSFVTTDARADGPIVLIGGDNCTRTEYVGWKWVGTGSNYGYHEYDSWTLNGFQCHLSYIHQMYYYYSGGSWHYYGHEDYDGYRWTWTYA